MKKVVILLVIFISFSLIAGNDYALPEQKVIEKIKIAYPASTLSILSVIIADKRGLFREEGMKSEMIMMRSNLAIVSMMKGDIDFMTAYGTTVRGAARGLPIKAIAVLADRPMHYLVSRPDIKSVKELKGKVIGLNTLLGTAHLITKEMIRYYGLNPDRDVTIIVAGDTQVRLEGIKAGSIQAAPVPIPGPILAKKMGLKILASAADIMELPLAGIGATDKKIKDERPQAKIFLKSVIRGLNYIRDNREESIKVIIEWLRVDRDTAMESYDLALRSYSKDGRMNEKGIRMDLDLVKEEGKIQEDIPISKVVDFSILEEIHRELRTR